MADKGPPKSAYELAMERLRRKDAEAGIAASALALHHQFLPPTINHDEPDPACDLDFIPNTGRSAAVDATLCNCLGFGSKNSAIVLGRVAS